MIYADDILKTGTYTEKKSLSDFTEGTISGAVVGMGGGALYAYFKKTPFIKTMIIGSVLGFAISGVFLIKK